MALYTHRPAQSNAGMPTTVAFRDTESAPILGRDSYSIRFSCFRLLSNYGVM